MAIKPSNQPVTFEQAMERLEKIVEEMESGKMPLEDLLLRYEEGMKLVKSCQEQLTRAEQKIEIITRDHAGKPLVKEFDAAEARVNATNDSLEEKDSDDVRLF